MSKMMARRRKAKKSRQTMSNLMESLKNIKVRVPVPPVGTSFASIKDYDRTDNKKAVQEGLDE